MFNKRSALEKKAFDKWKKTTFGDHLLKGVSLSGPTDCLKTYEAAFHASFLGNPHIHPQEAEILEEAVSKLSSSSSENNGSSLRGSKVRNGGTLELSDSYPVSITFDCFQAKSASCFNQKQIKESGGDCQYQPLLNHLEVLHLGWNDADDEQPSGDQFWLPSVQELADPDAPPFSLLRLAPTGVQSEERNQLKGLLGGNPELLGQLASLVRRIFSDEENGGGLKRRRVLRDSSRDGKISSCNLFHTLSVAPSAALPLLKAMCDYTEIQQQEHTPSSLPLLELLHIGPPTYLDRSASTDDPSVSNITLQEVIRIHQAASKLRIKKIAFTCDVINQNDPEAIQLLLQVSLERKKAAARKDVSSFASEIIINHLPPPPASLPPPPPPSGALPSEDGKSHSERRSALLAAIRSMGSKARPSEVKENPQPVPVVPTLASSTQRFPVSETFVESLDLLGGDIQESVVTPVLEVESAASYENSQSFVFFKLRGRRCIGAPLTLVKGFSNLVKGLLDDDDDSLEDISSRMIPINLDAPVSVRAIELSLQFLHYCSMFYEQQQLEESSEQNPSSDGKQQGPKQSKLDVIFREKYISPLFTDSIIKAGSVSTQESTQVAELRIRRSVAEELFLYSELLELAIFLQIDRLKSFVRAQIIRCCVDPKWDPRRLVNLDEATEE